jgi:hypothetical protein
MFLFVFLIALFFPNAESITAEELAQACHDNHAACIQCNNFDTNACKDMYSTCGETPELGQACRKAASICGAVAANDPTCLQYSEEAAELLTEYENSQTQKCFHGQDSVETLEFGLITIQQLAQEFTVSETSLHVKAWDVKLGKGVFSHLRGWIHADPQIETTFLEIFPRGSLLPLSLTPQHIIYRAANCKEHEVETVFAKRIREGDCIFVEEGALNNGTTMVPVTRIKEVIKRGIYAPLTGDGSIIVNNVAASCFANNEDEKLNKLVYSILFELSDWLKYILPSDWLMNVFGVGIGEISNSVPLIFSTFDHFQGSFVN